MKSDSRIKIILRIVVFIIITCYYLPAQGLFIQHSVDNSFSGACSVCSYDLDGDGDLDILAAGNSGNQIAWWKKENNSGITFSKFIIDANATGIIYVDAADIDRDNDLDVLGASWQGNEVAIWKNLGGDTLNWEKVVVDNNITQAHEVHGAYVDADTLLDIVAASGGDNQIIWYRNTGGDPIVWEKNIVDTQFTGARSVVSFDINKDGYNDLIGAALGRNQVSIWFNNGTNPIQWTKQIVDNAFGGAHWVHISDIDKDDNFDIIAAGAIPGEIAWWQNDGGNPIQWSKQIITSNFSGALSVSTADLDLDNDIDVFGAATNANTVRWWENDGNSPIQWSTNSILSSYTGAWSVFGVDLDEDGDIDILATASAGNKVTWLENTIITGIEEEARLNIPTKASLSQNYPNPFNPTTKIKYAVPSVGTSLMKFVQLKIYDVMGEEIATLVNEKKPAGEYEVEFDGSKLPSGVYLYRLKAGGFTQTKKMVLIK